MAGCASCETHICDRNIREGQLHETEELRNVFFIRSASQTRAPHLYYNIVCLTDIMLSYPCIMQRFYFQNKKILRKVSIVKTLYFLLALNYVAAVKMKEKAVR